jgi:hypothetical protein
MRRGYFKDLEVEWEDNIKIDLKEMGCENVD